MAQVGLGHPARHAPQERISTCGILLSKQLSHLVLTMANLQPQMDCEQTAQAMVLQLEVKGVVTALGKAMVLIES